MIVTGNNFYTASFSPDSYQLIVTNANPNMGSVSGSGTYQYSTTSRTISATPGTGYTFVQWNDGNSENPRTINLVQDTTFTAQFDVKTYQLTVVPNDSSYGTVSGGGNYIHNTQATLTATPNFGYQFYRWSDNNTSNPRMITMTQNKTITAQFAYKNINLSLSVNNSNRGTVLGAGSYVEGSSVDIMAIQNQGYKFSHWSDNVTTNPRTLTLTQDVTLTAYFDYMDTVTIHDTTTINNYIHDTSFVDVYVYLHDTTIVDNYFHDTLLVNVYIHDTTVIIDTITIQQELTYYTLSVMSANNSCGLVAGNGRFPEGTEVEIAAIPIEGNRFIQWNDGNTDNPRRINMEEDVTYIASFDASVGVTDMQESSYTIYSRDSQIIVNGAENARIRIFDAVGRLMSTTQSAEEVRVFNMPVTGVYMVQVGNYPAQKVVVVK